MGSGLRWFLFLDTSLHCEATESGLFIIHRVPDNLFQKRHRVFGECSAQGIQTGQSCEAQIVRRKTEFARNYILREEKS